MRYIILITSLSIYFSIPVLGAYQRVETAEVDSSPEIQNLAEFGMEEVLFKAATDGKIITQDFEISKISSVYRQISGDIISYKFECEFTDNKGTTIQATFEVQYSTKTNERSLVSLNYKVTRSGAIQLIEDSFVEVSAAEVEFSAEIEIVLNFGIDQLIEHVKADKMIQGSIDMVNLQDIQVSRQVISNALFYKCNITVEVQEGTTIEGVLTVYYQPTTTTRYLTDYSYKVKMEQRTRYVLGVRANNQTFKSLDVKTVQEDEEIYGLLEFGASAVTQLMIKDKKIADTDYEIVSVDAASTQLTTAGRFYNFTCQLQNQQGTLIQTTFTLLYNQTKPLATYSYSLINTKKTAIDKVIGALEEAYVPINVADINSDVIAKGALNAGVSQILRIGIDEKKIPSTGFSIKTIFEGYNQVIGNGIFYKFLCEIINKDKVTVGTNFTVYYQYQINETRLTSYSYNVNTVQTNTNTNTTSTVIKPIPSAYKPISASELQNNRDIKEVLEFGTQELIRNGIKNAKIPSSEYSIKEITEAYSQNVTTGSFYQFTCELNNGEGISVKANLTVYKSLKDASLILNTYSYSVIVTTYTTTTQNVEPVEGAYTAIDVLEVMKTEKTQDILQFGVQQLVNKGIQAGKIPADAYKMKTMFGAYKQSVQWGEFYKFEVLLDNDEGVTVNAIFVIYYRTASQEKMLVSYSYDVQIVKEVEVTQVVKPVESNYREIDVSRVQKDAKIKGNLEYGISFALEKGRSDGKVPESRFDISSILEAYVQNVSSGVFYKFNVELSSLEGVKISLALVVFEDNKSSKKTVASYSYKVITTIITTTVAGYVEAAFTRVNLTEIQHNDEIISCLQYGVQQILKSTDSYSVSRVNSVYRQVVEGALYYKFDIELTINEEKIAQTEFTIFYKPITKEKEVEAYSFKSSPIKPANGTSSGQKTQRYSVIPLTEIQKKVAYQEILQYGLQECIKSLMSYKIVKSANLRVSQIISAYKKGTEDEYYKFKVQLVNEVGVSIELSLEVKYQSSTKKKTLVAYAIEGTSDSQVEYVLLVDYEEGREKDLVMGNYEKVGGSEVKANVEIQLAIQYGLKEALQKVVQKEKLGAMDLKLKEVKKVYREIVDRKSYKFELSLGNSKEEIVEMNIFVDYSTELGVKKVVSFSYILY